MALGGSAPTTGAEKDGRFTIDVAAGEVVLTVQKAHGGGRRVEVPHVIQALKAKGIEAFDKAKVDLAVNLADGKPVVIGVREAQGARAEVTVSDDGLEAHVSILPPAPGGAEIDSAALEGALREAGVLHGTDEKAVKELVEKRIYGVKRLVAKGQAAVPGKDGRIVFHFDRTTKRPKEDEETGRVDHRELGLIVNVRKGDLLATIEPPTEGTPGMTVRGNPIPAVAGRPVENPAAEGTESTDGADGRREIRAACDGRVIVRGGAGHEKISVSPVYEVSGDVGPETGNIHFVGSVNVRGSVEDGFSIEAGEDVTIGGTVGKCVVKAGRDLTIRGGLLGKKEGRLEAGGTLRARFVQEGTVEAGKDVVIDDFLMHSSAMGDRVLVGFGEGKRKRKGLVVGGQVRATREIACQELGSEVSTKTEVQAGVNPKLLRRLEELTKQLEADKETFDKVRKGLAVLESIKEKLGALPPDKAQIHQSLTATQGTLQARLTQVATELRDLQAQSARPFRAKISVAGTTHPGTKVMVRNEALYVNKSNNYTTYILEDGKIRPVPFEAPKLDEEAEAARMAEKAAGAGP